MGHFDPRVFTTLVESVARSIAQAYANLSPALISSQTLKTEGLVTNRADPDGLIDDEHRVIAWYRPGAQHPFAAIANFSAHPTALGAWNTYVSADYPGVMAREIELRIPG